MSLIHWWPLNGNTNDYGVNSLALINNGATINSNGKIGSCYYFDGNASYLQTTIEAGLFDGTGHPFSFTFWMKFTDELADRKIIFGDYSLADHYFNIEMSYGSASYSGRIRFCGSNSCDYGFTVATGIKDTGQHYAITYDGINKISLYKDGTFIESATATLNAASSGTYYIGRDGRTGSTALKGYLNDFRIYNHALSAKEVKEISKGLILHYDFEDEEIEQTTNLISTINSNNKSLPKAGNGVDLQTDSGDAYCSLVLSAALVNGNVYTLSFDVNNLNNNEYISFGFYDGGTHNNTTINKNGRASITFTAGNTASSLTFDDGGRTNTTIISLRNFQLEAKDHATPYVNGTRSAGKVYDSSGYGYNGTNNGVTLSNDSSSGRFSAKFASNAYIEIPSLPQFDKVTYSMGVKIPSNTNAYRSIFIPKGSPTGDGIGLSINTEGVNLWAYQGGNAPNYCKGASTLLSADTGYLYTHTFDGTTGKNYLNGVAVGSAATYTTRTYIPSGVYTLGDSYTGTSGNGTPFDGKIADFKIYSTALSAEDILAEYNRKAVIDKNGNLFTGEIIETAGSAIKIDKNSFIDSNLFATTMTLEDGSTGAPICVHYIPDGMFTGANQTFYYTGRNIWENFGAINDLERPESNQGEFYVMQQSIVGGPFSKYRFKQNVSPLSATWDQVNPSKVGTNVTRISATSTNNYAGMYGFNTSNIAMCFANTSNGNGFGCGARTYGGDDYTPGYNGEQVRGWQLVYMRISKHKARMFKNGIMIPTDIIEN